MARFRFGVPLLLLLVSVASARNPPPSDPQAVSLATQGMTALKNVVAVRDITVYWTAFSNSFSPHFVIQAVW
jgi:hypothetical protein